MKVTRTSALSGVTRTRELNITNDQIKAYNDGALIQRAFPNLSPGDREFYKTGITDSEWEEAFNEPA